MSEAGRVINLVTGDQIFLSHRGELLIVTNLRGERPLLTVELRGKWYELFLLHPDNRIESVSFEELHYIYGSGYVDHCPRPVAVEQLAARREWDLDEVAMELIIGRWVS